MPRRLPRDIGPVAVPIDADAAVRVLQRPVASWIDRTVPAWKILADAEARTLLGGRIVLVGSGAPEVGGLRTTPVSAATPSVQIQADAVETLLSGAIPRRPPWVPRAEIWAAVFLGLASIAFAVLCRAVVATVVPGALCLVWIFGAIGAFHFEHLLIDMSGPLYDCDRRVRGQYARQLRATSGVSGAAAAISSSIWRRTSSSGWSTRRASCVSTAKAGW